MLASVKSYKREGILQNLAGVLPVPAAHFCEREGLLVSPQRAQIGESPEVVSPDLVNAIVSVGITFFTGVYSRLKSAYCPW